MGRGFLRTVSRWSRSPGCCGFRGVSGWGGFFRVCVFFSAFVFFERTRPNASMRPPLASFTSLLVMRQGRGSESTEAVFCLPTNKPLLTVVRTGCHYLVRVSVCVRVCVTFAVFTDCESCARPIPTNSGSMESGECGRTRGTCSSHTVSR